MVGECNCFWDQKCYHHHELLFYHYTKLSNAAYTQKFILGLLFFLVFLRNIKINIVHKIGLTKLFVTRVCPVYLVKECCQFAVIYLFLRGTWAGIVGSWESSEPERWEMCMSVVGWQDRTGRRVVRWHGWRGWEVVRWQFGKRGRVVRWQVRKDGRVARWQGGRFLVLFIDGRCRVKPRFHLFISDANQQNKIVKKGVNSTKKIPTETVYGRRNSIRKKYTFFEEMKTLYLKGLTSCTLVPFYTLYTLCIIFSNKVGRVLTLRCVFDVSLTEFTHHHQKLTWC